MLLRNGDPKISVRMIETKETNPRPINSGDPHLQYCERPIGFGLDAEIQFGFRRGDVGTKLEETSLWATPASVGPSSPVRNTRLAYERGTNNQDDGSRHHWREYPSENLGGHQRHENFEESAYEGCSYWVVRNLPCKKAKNHTEEISVGIGT